MTLNELFTQLGMADYIFIETSNYLDDLRLYRESILNEIEKKNNGNND